MKGLLKPNPTRPVADRPFDPAPIVEEELLTDEQVCAILKVKKQWLRDHTTRVEPIIPHIRTMGRHIRYPKHALFAWISRQIETRPSWERKSTHAF
jgi:hypothetical protein